MFSTHFSCCNLRKFLLKVDSPGASAMELGSPSSGGSSASSSDPLYSYSVSPTIKSKANIQDMSWDHCIKCHKMNKVIFTLLPKIPKVTAKKACSLRVKCCLINPLNAIGSNRERNPSHRIYNPRVAPPSHFAATVTYGKIQLRFESEATSFSEALLIRIQVYTDGVRKELFSRDA